MEYPFHVRDGKLQIINEVTGNWYTTIRGSAQDYRYRDECREEPAFTTLG